MKRTIPSRRVASNKKTQLLLTTLGKRMKREFENRRYAEALQASLQAINIAPELAEPWTDAAVCHVWLQQWDDAIRCADEALKRNGNSLPLFDALAHAWGYKRDLEQTRRWGCEALARRAALFASPPRLAHDVASVALPPPPNEATKAHNVIAFSLFGAQSKYCEPAVLNVLEQPNIYPHWTCRFYVDASVPADVVDRLRRAGAEVVFVDAMLQRWPGPMWRFAAYDSPGLHRVIFRDADSVISEREAAAVAEWIDSGRHFHHMRDSSTHTELLLAGTWGVSAGALPPMHRLIASFLTRPLTSRHFADQHFLREFVWPYARQSLLQHDSVFGFMDARPFPHGSAPDDFHVGYVEAASTFDAKTALPDGCAVDWELVAAPPGQQLMNCRYPGVVANGAVRMNLPRRYTEPLQRGELRIAVKQRGEG